jgi:hypothetical protein
MESVHYYVRGLFRGIPETEKITEQREELESHINDRIADMMGSGLTENDAFTKVVDSLGNLYELIDTMTGERKKIYKNKLDWLNLAAATVYGTLYMLAVGIWFSFQGFGLYAIYVAIPGWLGFVIPTLIAYIEYRRQPEKTAVIAVDMSAEIKSSTLGWIGISLACWTVNILLVGSGTFLHVIWAWMPTVGVFTWPLMTGLASWMIRNCKAIDPENA